MDYGLSNSISDTDERQPKWQQQRIERGFDDTETWALDSTIAKFIAPRLKRFKEVQMCSWYFEDIDDYDEKRTDMVLDKMIRAFEIIADPKEAYRWEKDLMVEVEEGLDWFRKYFFHLWW